MNTTNSKPTRLAAIEALPGVMQDHALVDWPTCATLCCFKDTEHARETLIKAGVPLVHISDRKRLPTWGALRAFTINSWRIVG